MLMPALEQRQSLISFSKGHGISAVFHHLPLHLSLVGQRFGGQPVDCPVTENVSDRSIRLPFYSDLTPADLELIVGAVRS
jgi:dTDP-4-amino-4,6-dideoxygalactose transaminase